MKYVIARAARLDIDDIAKFYAREHRDLGSASEQTTVDFRYMVSLTS